MRAILDELAAYLLHPLPAFAIGLCVGFVLAALLAASHVP